MSHDPRFERPALHPSGFFPGRQNSAVAAEFCLAFAHFGGVFESPFSKKTKNLKKQFEGQGKFFGPRKKDLTVGKLWDVKVHKKNFRQKLPCLFLITLFILTFLVHINKSILHGKIFFCSFYSTIVLLFWCISTAAMDIRKKSLFRTTNWIQVFLLSIKKSIKFL